LWLFVVDESLTMYVLWMFVSLQMIQSIFGITLTLSIVTAVAASAVKPVPSWKIVSIKDGEVEINGWCHHPSRSLDKNGHPLDGDPSGLLALTMKFPVGAVINIDCPEFRTEYNV